MSFFSRFQWFEVKPTNGVARTKRNGKRKGWQNVNITQLMDGYEAKKSKRKENRYTLTLNGFSGYQCPWNLSFNAFSNSSPNILTRRRGNLLYKYDITKFSATWTSMCILIDAVSFFVVLLFSCLYLLWTSFGYAESITSKRITMFLFLFHNAYTKRTRIVPFLYFFFFSAYIQWFVFALVACYVKNYNRCSMCFYLSWQNVCDIYFFLLVVHTEIFYLLLVLLCIYYIFG